MKNKHSDIIARHLDPELDQLIDNALLYISPSQAKTYVETVERFNKRESYVMEGDSSKPVYWYKLREDLRLFPTYFAVMEQGGAFN
jgi:hypothetical protein